MPNERAVEHITARLELSRTAGFTAIPEEGMGMV